MGGAEGKVAYIGSKIIQLQLCLYAYGCQIRKAPSDQKGKADDLQRPRAR